VTSEIQQLFTETRLAFDNSQTKKFATEKNLQWYYSISSTQLKRSSIVIAGFNWGASKDHTYKPQTQIPPESFKDLYATKNSLAHYNESTTR